MIAAAFVRLGKSLGSTALLLTLISGCSVFTSTVPPPAYYSLDHTRREASPARAVRTGGLAAATQSEPVQGRTNSKGGPTLIVHPPSAASGYDSPRILYVREDHQLEYFAHSEWVDTPAHMLEPLMVAAIRKGATFHAVVPTPSTAAGDLRLNTEVIRLHQVFTSGASYVRFTLRAYLVDNVTRRVLAWREFDQSVAAESADTYGGVVAANRVVQSVLEQLAGFCSETARR
jgi:cholesterol transport system auxiliary component